MLVRRVCSIYVFTIIYVVIWHICIDISYISMHVLYLHYISYKSVHMIYNIPYKHIWEVFYILWVCISITYAYIYLFVSKYIYHIYTYRQEYYGFYEIQILELWLDFNPVDLPKVIRSLVLSQLFFFAYACMHVIIMC